MKKQNVVFILQKYSEYSQHNLFNLLQNHSTSLASRLLLKLQWQNQKWSGIFVRNISYMMYSVLPSLDGWRFVLRLFICIFIYEHTFTCLCLFFRRDSSLDLECFPLRILFDVLVMCTHFVASRSTWFSTCFCFCILCWEFTLYQFLFQAFWLSK